MWLIVGLGNPGTKYQLNRHNIGFMLVDAWTKNLGIHGYQSEHKAQIAKVKSSKPSENNLIFLKPQTYMNLSGESVISAMNFYKVPKENLIVVHDEIDQPFGQLKLQKNRGHGGHNGVRNITELLGSPDYYRIRLGVGRPTIPQMNVADWVLQDFSKQEISEIPGFLTNAIEGIESLMRDGLNKAATNFNK